MDFTKFKPYHWMMVAGAVGWLIFGLFVNWVGDDGAPTFNAFDFTLTGVFPWLLFIAVGVVAFLLGAGIINRAQAPWPLILLIAAGVALLLNLILVLAGPEASGGGMTIELKRGIGLWLSFLFGVVSLAGAVMYFLDSGGDFKNLGNSLKGGNSNQGGRNYPTGGGYQSPPPPPPGGNNPPPPPPSR